MLNGVFVLYPQACGHRWKNVFYVKKEHKLPHGICFAIPPDFRTELSRRVCPCYIGKQNARALLWERVRYTIEWGRVRKKPVLL